MKTIILHFVIGIGVLHLVLPGVRADYFGKIEPRLFQLEDGKKVDFKKPSKNPQFTAIYYSAPGPATFLASTSVPTISIRFPRMTSAWAHR